MKYIELKFNADTKRRMSSLFMGGFELCAPVKYDNGKVSVRKGQLSLDFQLEIPPHRDCRVPDTEWNRKKLRILTVGQTRRQVIHDLNPVTGKYEPMMKESQAKPTFVLARKYDLSEVAPIAGVEAMTPEEVAEMKKKLDALEKANVEKAEIPSAPAPFDFEDEPESKIKKTRKRVKKEELAEV